MLKTRWWLQPAVRPAMGLLAALAFSACAASRRSLPSQSPPRVGLLVVLFVLSGCNFVNMRADVIRHKFGDADMAAHDARIGEAQVHYWASEALVDGRRTAQDDLPLVVLIHGFGASAMWQWHEQVGALARTHRLLVPDLLWFGGSSSTQRDFSIDHQVAVLLSLLDEVGADEVKLVGISYGGLVAYEFASQEPGRVTRLVIADSPGRVYRRTDYDALCRRFSVDHIGDILLPQTDAGVSTLMSLAYYDPPWTPEWALGQVRAGLYGEFRQEKRLLLDALLSDLEELSGRADPVAETLLIWGREDPVFPLAIGARLRAHLGANAQLTVLDRAKHAPNLEHPMLFNRTLMDFL